MQHVYRKRWQSNHGVLNFWIRLLHQSISAMDPGRLEWIALLCRGRHRYSRPHQRGLELLFPFHSTGPHQQQPITASHTKRQHMCSVIFLCSCFNYWPNNHVQVSAETNGSVPTCSWQWDLTDERSKYEAMKFSLLSLPKVTILRHGHTLRSSEKLYKGQLFFMLKLKIVQLRRSAISH